MSPSSSLKSGSENKGSGASNDVGSGLAGSGSSVPAENPCPSNSTPLGVTPNAASSGDAPSFAGADNSAATNSEASTASTTPAETTKTASASGFESPVSGSGLNAGIGGQPGAGGGANEGSLAETLGRLSQSLDAMNAPKTKSFGDHAKDLNQHVAQEKAHTAVSINTHHAG